MMVLHTWVPWNNHKKIIIKVQNI
jgi:hypothetical protein